MREPGGKLEEQPGGVARDCKAQSGHRWVGLKEREIQEFRSVGEEQEHHVFWTSKRD